MLIDTDVLIWMTRGHAGAAAKLQTLVPWRISAVTYMELAQGCRSKEELNRIKKGLTLCQTVIVPISVAISDRAMQLIDGYALSHSLQLGDALIAATALEQKEIDAAFFVAGIDAVYIQRLFKDPEIRLVELTQAKAYERQFRFLKKHPTWSGKILRNRLRRPAT